MLYLASQSPRRREILNQIGVSYEVIPQNINESAKLQESPEDYVQRLALEKAEAGLTSLSDKSDNVCVLGADTIVVLDGQILGKPSDRQSAYDMLTMLSGRTHRVMSGVAVLDFEKRYCDFSMTEVLFRPLDVSLIEKYWQTGEPRDKAGGYAIQGYGAIFVEKIKGSYSGVVGLPIEVLSPLLAKFNVPYWVEK